MKIRLVEDHEEIRDLRSRRLNRRGFDVVVATDGQDGVDKSRSEAPDLVPRDMNLPAVDARPPEAGPSRHRGDARDRADRACHVGRQG